MSVRTEARLSEPHELSKRERQIMDVIYARREATATDVVGGIPDAPTRAAVRTILRILEMKGHLAHRKVGREFVYRPLRPRQRAGRSALQRVLNIFYEGSIEKALGAHLADPVNRLSRDEAQRLAELISEAKQRGD